MRKLAIIALLFIYTISQLGSVMVAYYKPVVRAISSYRQQRRMRLEETALKDTSISVKQYLACLQEKDELLINGVLHDIKNAKFENGIVHLQLLEDSKETNWMNGFAGFVNALQKQKRSQRSMLQVWNWLFNIYPFEKEINFGFQAPLPLKHRFAFGADPLSSLPLSSPGQPPEMIC